MRKKHQPGCPCCTAPNPCGCDISQLRVDITSNELYSILCGAAPIGGPCPYNDFTFEMSGTYYVTPTTEETTVVLGVFYNTNGLQQCETSKYCIAIIIAVTTIECYVKFSIEMIFFWNPSGNGTECPEIEEEDPYWTISGAYSYESEYVNWCESIDEEWVADANGTEECPGTDLTIQVQIYPSI